MLSNISHSRCLPGIHILMTSAAAARITHIDAEIIGETLSIRALPTKLYLNEQPQRIPATKNIAKCAHARKNV